MLCLPPGAIQFVFYHLQSDHTARDETPLNPPSDGSEDQEEARESADQSGEGLFPLIFLLLSSMSHWRSSVLKFDLL